MKHLKSFNEDLLSDNLIQELQDFCETSLAYLLDEGFKVIIDKETLFTKEFTGTCWVVGLHKLGTTTTSERWDDIKDYYIPFLKLILRRYGLGWFGAESIYGKERQVRFYTGDHHRHEYFTLEQVINDEIPVEDLYEISIRVLYKYETY